MKNKFKSKFLSKIAGCLTALIVCGTNLPSLNADAATVITENKTGTEDGYAYELWKDSGNTTMTLTGNGTFTCEWNNINNCLFRKGQKFDCTQTYQDLNGVYIDYGVDYKPNGNSYMCVYGWTRNPLVEYYIVETWGSWRPPGATSALGTVSVDGGTYDIYKTTRVNQPSIDGNTTFDQYWSVRQNKPSANGTKIEGRISVSKHFEAWEKVGLKMGKMYEVALNIEGYQSSGSANVYKNVLTIGKGEGGTTDPTTPDTPTTPDEEGFYFFNTFEDGVEGWESRGATTVSSSSTNAYSGSKSLFISGREDTWQGASYSLRGFSAGSTYSFGTMIMQNSLSTEEMRMTLQYTDSSGETQYDTVAVADAEKGKWTKLENTAYTIPAGASDLLLYVESTNELVDFYIDEAFGATKGMSTGGTASGPIIGDVDNSGKVDSKDIEDLQAYILGKDVTISYTEADVNKDGVIDATDLAALRRLINSGKANTTVTTKTPAIITTTTTTTTQKPSAGGVDTSWIDPSKPMVAISFDDGAVGTSPNSSSITILNALAYSSFNITFFYVGDWTNANNQGEIKKAYELGMEIANHTTSHPYLTNLSSNEIRSEYENCANKLKSIIGTDPSPLLRLPYLASNSTVQSTLYDAPLITCAIDTQDWNNASSDQIISTIKNAMNNGSLKNSIVLCHETYDSTAAAMEYLCPYLKSQGWQIVTISEMFAVNGKTLNGGQIYTKCN